MIKKLVGFLTVLCMAFFIAGCSSTPDVSGMYLCLDTANKPIAAVILKNVSDNAYDCSYFISNREQTKMLKIYSDKRVSLNTEKKVLQENEMTRPILFFNKDYSYLKEVDNLKNKEYIYNKLSDSEMKQYQHLFE